MILLFSGHKFMEITDYVYTPIYIQSYFVLFVILAFYI